MGFIGIFLLAIVFMFIAIVLCIGLILGIVGSIVFTIRHNKTKSRISQVFRILSYVLLGLNGTAILSIVILATITSLTTKSTIPSDFVYCEEAKLTEEGFTVGSETYVKLDYRIRGDVQGTPRFSYMPEGKFQKSEWFNFYEAVTESGYSVYFRHDINFNGECFIKIQDQGGFLEYYESTVSWYMHGYNDQIYEVPAVFGAYFDGLKAAEMKEKEPNDTPILRMWMYRETKSHEFYQDYVGCYTYSDNGKPVYCIKNPVENGLFMSNSPVCIMDEALGEELVNWFEKITIESKSSM